MNSQIHYHVLMYSTQILWLHLILFSPTKKTNERLQQEGSSKNDECFFNEDFVIVFKLFFLRNWEMVIVALVALLEIYFGGLLWPSS